MSKQQQFRLVWEAFWCGLITGVGAVMFGVYGREQPDWMVFWIIGAPLAMAVPAATESLARALRRRRGGGDPRSAA